MNKKKAVHIPVLLDEVIEQLNIKKDGIYIDATMGDAGHSEKILKQLGSGKLISLDWDINSINWVKKNKYLSSVDNWFIEHTSFVNIPEILKKHDIEKVDGILFDIGLSSRQLSNKKRGFSYYGEGDIDMRMDDRLSVKAKDLLMALSKKELATLFEYTVEIRFKSKHPIIIRKGKTIGVICACLFPLCFLQPYTGILFAVGRGSAILIINN